VRSSLISFKFIKELEVHHGVLAVLPEFIRALADILTQRMMVAYLQCL
jgi:hypothetical protein